MAVASTTVFTDAACIHNGRPHACSAFRLFFGDNDVRNTIQVILPGAEVNTNNRAHLHALIWALRTCDGWPVCVQTCSKLTVSVCPFMVNCKHYYLHSLFFVLCRQMVHVPSLDGTGTVGKRRMAKLWPTLICGN